MSTRIPSSLKWLIDKRGRLDAEIKKTEASLSKAKELIEELSSLKENLAAVDLTLSLHNLDVDVNLIRPIRSQYVRINLPHGELARSILLCLRLHQDEGPVSTSELIAFISSRFADLSAKPEERSTLRLSVHNRLKNMCRAGILQRHHDPNSCNEGIWSLAPEAEDVE